MEESKLSLDIVKEILNDDIGAHPEETCFRQCIYHTMGIVDEKGELNVS
jgi:hypothetical protein